MKSLTHHHTLHLFLKIKCCVDRLRPPRQSRHGRCTYRPPKSSRTEVDPASGIQRRSFGFGNHPQETSFTQHLFEEFQMRTSALSLAVFLALGSPPVLAQQTSETVDVGSPAVPAPSSTGVPTVGAAPELGGPLLRDRD